MSINFMTIMLYFPWNSLPSPSHLQMNLKSLNSLYLPYITCYSSSVFSVILSFAFSTPNSTISIAIEVTKALKVCFFFQQ